MQLVIIVISNQCMQEVIGSNLGEFNSNMHGYRYKELTYVGLIG